MGKCVNLLDNRSVVSPSGRSLLTSDSGVDRPDRSAKVGEELADRIVAAVLSEDGLELNVLTTAAFEVISL